ncbi:MAG: PcfJ domain-containing protein [Alphaproteobacteria bacterium]|nr:PcfJ domain-containing protein [Alphaproteobacteria bacterium]MCL2505087.1 PcfJ domain-containing protein [Alphaproteobacteria bacterium]
MTAHNPYIVSLVADGDENKQSFLNLDISTLHIDFANLKPEEFGLSPADLDISPYLVIFDKKYALLKQLPDIVKTSIEANIKEKPEFVQEIEFDSTCDTLNLDELQKLLASENRKDELQSIRGLKRIDGKDNTANIKLFSYLSRELKAKVCAVVALEKYYPNSDDYNRDDMIHIRDYIVQKVDNMDKAEVSRLKPDSFTKAATQEAMYEEAETFFEAERVKAGATQEQPGDKEELSSFYLNGTEYKFYNLLTENALKYEGDKMNHCVGGYWSKVETKEVRIISLRDDKNEPRATLEIDTKTNTIIQIQGRKNKNIDEKYHQMILDFVSEPKWEIEVNDRFFEKIPAVRLKDGKIKLWTDLDIEDARNGNFTRDYGNSSMHTEQRKNVNTIVALGTDDDKWFLNNTLILNNITQKWFELLPGSQIAAKKTPFNHTHRR